jgi:hypothetical protein
MWRQRGAEVKARAMSNHKIINRVLGRRAAFDVDVDEVTSILNGRSQPRRSDAFRGFNSPPVHASARTETPPLAEKSSATEKRGSKPNAKGRKRIAVPAPDRF